MLGTSLTLLLLGWWRRWRRRRLNNGELLGLWWWRRWRGLGATAAHWAAATTYRESCSLKPPALLSICPTWLLLLHLRRRPWRLLRWAADHHQLLALRRGCHWLLLLLGAATTRAATAAISSHPRRALLRRELVELSIDDVPLQYGGNECTEDGIAGE